ncbi:MAG: hypothetical protein ACK4TG_08720, partial [Thermaurantiacus sp.]
MAIEAAAAAGALPPAFAATAPEHGRHLAAGRGASLAEEASFRGALERATLLAAVPGADPIGPAARGVMSALEHVNAQARGVAEFAASVTASGREMTPAEVITLTMRCQEFMFHCQLSSNIANRTSDGLQQL